MLFDLLGALLSLLSTYYFIRLDNRSWIIGLIATCINGALYWHKGIYADMALELIYFLSMGYGLYQWKFVSPKTIPPRRMSKLTKLQWGLLLIFPVLLFIALYYLLRNFTQSNVALLDAITTSLSLTAQWLMCHKIIGTWILWFITDALYGVMYFNKNLPFHVCLMLIYTGLAITGYLSWKRKQKFIYEARQQTAFAQ